MHDDVITPRQLLEEAQDGLGTSKILFLATLNYFIDIYNDIHIFFFSECDPPKFGGCT